MGEDTGPEPIGKSDQVALVDPAVAADSPSDLARPIPAVLTISLGPAFPGNVHVYDIKVDPCYGTFTGVAGRTSNIRGERITGALSVGNIDIDFTAVYPTPAYDYAWFGTGPLGGFTGGDSLGNVMDALSSTVTYLDDDRDETPDGEVVAEASVDAAEVAPSKVATEVAPEVVTDIEPVEARVELDQSVDSSPNDVEVHTAGCQCLLCRWAAFKPVLVTEGPFAGTAFYFGASTQLSDDETRVESSESGHADTRTNQAAHSNMRGKRRRVSSPTRR